MNVDLNGKRALVTGAGSGIGAAVAVALAAAGAEVAVHARTIEAATPTVDRIRSAGQRAFAVAADLQDPAAIRAMCETAIAGLGGIDIVMNNAGTYLPARLVDTDDAVWDRTLDVNLKAAFQIARHTLPNMIAQNRGGRQLFTSSVSAKMGELDGSAYCASKAGIGAIVRCLAMEVGQHGITVNAICPGWVNTPMAHAAHEHLVGSGQTIDEVLVTSMSSNPLRVVIDPGDIANMAVFLASDKARCVTGQSINVCAGYCTTL